MEAIIFLIAFVIFYNKAWESKKEDRMTSDQRFKHELDKIK